MLKYLILKLAYAIIIYGQAVPQNSGNNKPKPAPFPHLKQQTPNCPIENEKLQCNFAHKYSLIDGSCNNLHNPWVGKSNTPYKRYAPNTYEDGVSKPRHSAANPRSISQSISADLDQTETHVSHLLTLFAQFVAHDVSLANRVPGLFFNFRSP